MMEKAPRKYMKELRSELGFYPTWLPTQTVTLGSYGLFVDGAFRVEGGLSQLGIPFESMQDEQTSDWVKYSGLHFGFGSSAKAEASSTDIASEVTITAESKYAWGFGAKNARGVRIANIGAVARTIMDLREMKSWKDKWLLVSEIQKVETLNVLIASAKHAHGKLKAKANLCAPEKILAEGELVFESDSTDLFIIPRAKRTTPLFRLHRVRGLFDKEVRPISSEPDRRPVLDLRQDDTVEMYELAAEENMST